MEMVLILVMHYARASSVRYKTKVGSFFNGYQLWSLFTVFATKVGSFLVFLCGEIGSPSPNLTAKEYVTEKHLFHMMAHVLPGKNL